MATQKARTTHKGENTVVNVDYTGTIGHNAGNRIGHLHMTELVRATAGSKPDTCPFAFVIRFDAIVAENDRLLDCTFHAKLPLWQRIEQTFIENAELIVGNSTVHIDPGARRNNECTGIDKQRAVNHIGDRKSTRLNSSHV